MRWTVKRLQSPDVLKTATWVEGWIQSLETWVALNDLHCILMFYDDCTDFGCSSISFLTHSGQLQLQIIIKLSCQWNGELWPLTHHLFQGFQASLINTWGCDRRLPGDFSMKNTEMSTKNSPINEKGKEKIRKNHPEKSYLELILKL